MTLRWVNMAHDCHIDAAASTSVVAMRAVLCQLARHADEEGRSSVSIEVMTGRLGGVRQTVTRAVQALELQGIITRFGVASRGAVVWQLSPDPCHGARGNKHHPCHGARGRGGLTPVMALGVTNTTPVMALGVESASSDAQAIYVFKDKRQKTKDNEDGSRTLTERDSECHTPHEAADDLGDVRGPIARLLAEVTGEPLLRTSGRPAAIVQREWSNGPITVVEGESRRIVGFCEVWEAVGRAMRPWAAWLRGSGRPLDATYAANWASAVLRAARADQTLPEARQYDSGKRESDPKRRLRRQREAQATPKPLTDGTEVPW